MRFSFIQKEPTSMYFYNAFTQSPAVAPLTMEAFVAPANFDPDAQELNIVKAFAAYPDINKKYIFSVDTSTTTVLPAVTGRSYAYSESGGAYTTIASGTVTWTVGSTKRNVVTIDVNTTVTALISDGAVWLYCSSNINGISCAYIGSIKYIHVQSLESIVDIGYSTHIKGCANLSGILHIGANISAINHSLSDSEFGYQLSFDDIVSSNSRYVVEDHILYDKISTTNYEAIYSAFNYVGTLTINPYTTVIPYACFYYSKRIGTLSIPDSVKAIGSFAFIGCLGLVGDLLTGDGVETIGAYAFVGCYGFTGNLVLGNSLKAITSLEGFSGCTGFNNNLVVGSSLETFAESGIGYQIQFKNIQSSSPHFIVEDKVLYQIVSSTEYIAVASARGYSGTLTLSPFTKTILYACFYQSYRYGSLSLPASLQNINSHALNYSGVSGQINSYNPIPPICGPAAMQSISKTDVVVHVPVGSLAAYRAENVWSEFVTIIEDL
jgi:hypothetical protein